MKKILIVSNHLQYGDGVCRTLISFANLLNELGYEVTISFMLRFDKRLLPLFDKNIKIRRAFSLPVFKGWDRLMSFLPSKFLYNKASKKEKFDIEIGYCWRNPTIAIANSTNKEAKHIMYTHGYNDASKYYHRFDCVFAQSKGMANLIEKDKKSGVPIYLFHNCFDDQTIIEHSLIAPNYTKNPDKKLFVVVGRVTTEKGCFRLLEVAKRLINEGKDFELWYLGSGYLEKDMNVYIKENHLEENIKLLGVQSNPYNLIKQADCLICPSTQEGYNTACVEACILEVPVLTTDVFGAIDIVEEAKAGKVVENNEEGLYEGFKFVLDHPEEIAKWKETLKTTKFNFYKETKKELLINLLSGIEKSQVN